MVALYEYLRNYTHFQMIPALLFKPQRVFYDSLFRLENQSNLIMENAISVANLQLHHRTIFGPTWIPVLNSGLLNKQRRLQTNTRGYNVYCIIRSLISNNTENI